MENIVFLDLVGTAVFAYAGSTVTRKRGFGVMTVCALGIATAIGGGTLRQWLLQADTLFWLEDFRYLLVSFTAIAFGYMTSFKLDVNAPYFRVIDNLAIGIFISIGYSVATDLTDSIAIAVALSLCTGIGGGLIRDALLARVPQALTDPLVPCLLLASLTGIYVANSVGVESWVGSCIGITFIEASRIVAKLSKRNNAPRVVNNQTLTQRLARSFSAS